MRDMSLTSSKTKMKINLCIFLLCNTAVSVFGQSVELNGIVGKSIEFPAAVKIDGNLMYSSVTIGVVISGRFTTPDKYKDRVQWDSSTGLFSLSELKLKDSGVYTVQNTDQNINTVFQLNVYIPVSKPHVSTTHDEYPCALLCSVERGTGVTLSWYREGDKRWSIHTHPLSAPDLKLPVLVDKGGIYSCEARNSVSRETSDPLTVGTHCTAPAGSSTGTIVAIFIAVVFAIFDAVVFAVLYRRLRGLSKGKNKLGIEEGDPSHLRDDLS